MKTLENMRDVLGRVSFSSYEFQIKMDDDRPVLRIRCAAPCNVTGKDSVWFSRKWFLTHHMTDGEIVQTALKAVLTAQEHEAREQFTYRGVPIFDPHYDIEKLVELRRQHDSTVERGHTDPVLVEKAITHLLHREDA